jgi:nucleotide-binding universal stress UspA family protein
MFKRILVPVDGSETSNRALVAALQIARETGGRVRVIHSVDELVYVADTAYDPTILRSAREWAGKILQEALEVARATGVPADSRLVEAPGRRLGEVVADEAQAWEADLVVVGTHGRKGVGRVLLGSGAEQVLRASRVPVLSVRGSNNPVLD